jgi:hypothetical protein
MWTFLSQIGHRHENLVTCGSNNRHQSASIGKDAGPQSAARRPLSVARPDRRDTECERVRPETLGNRRRLVKRRAGRLRLTARGEVPAIIGERSTQVPRATCAPESRHRFGELSFYYRRARLAQSCGKMCLRQC